MFDFFTKPNKELLPTFHNQMNMKKIYFGWLFQYYECFRYFLDKISEMNYPVISWDAPTHAVTSGLLTDVTINDYNYKCLFLISTLLIVSND